jgi:hypothetical protein
MLRLMRRDLMLNWNMLLLMLALVAGMTVYMGSENAPPTETLAIVMVICSAICLTIPAREDRFHAAAFTCSLPVSRTRVTLARYLLPVVLFPFLLALVVLLHGAIRGFRFPADILEPGAILFLLALYLLTIGVFFPFTIRFGFTGLMIGLIALQVLSVALLMLSTKGTRAGMADLAGGIASLFAGLEAGIGKAAYLGLLLAALLCLYAASFLASDAIFRRKEL